MWQESVVVEKVPNDCCREVLEKTAVEMSWKACSREVLEKVW